MSFNPYCWTHEVVLLYHPNRGATMMSADGKSSSHLVDLSALRPFVSGRNIVHFPEQIVRVLGLALYSSKLPDKPHQYEHSPPPATQFGHFLHAKKGRIE
jgi:hypothetical protein